eukprot:4754398-Prorocentrum_lima.AAC.1
MTSSLVGSEMCIRDRCVTARHWPVEAVPGRMQARDGARGCAAAAKIRACLLYTSDAADDM